MGKTLSSTDGGFSYYLRYTLVPEPASRALWPWLADFSALAIASVG